jgi:hypothetical protein
MKEPLLMKMNRYLFFITILVSLNLTCVPAASYDNPTDGAMGFMLDYIPKLLASLIPKDSGGGGGDTTTIVTEAIVQQDLVITGLPSAITEGQESVVSVKLVKAIDTNVTLTITMGSTAISIDGGISKTITFTPANATTNQSFSLYAYQDTNTVSENISITFSATGLTAKVFNITSLDNTPSGTGAAPVISVSGTPNSIREGNSANIGVKLTGVVTSNFTVNIATSRSTAINPATTSLTFTPQNYTVDQTVTLNALQDDNIVSELVTITISGAGLPTVSFTVTATDDDTMNFVVSTLSVVNEGSTASMTVRLTNQPSSNLSVSVSSSNPGAVTVNGADTATLTFTSSNWNTNQTLTLAGVEDSNQNTDTVPITVSATGVTSNSQNILAIDNDTRPVFGGAVSVVEGSTAVMKLSLSGNPGANRSVVITSNSTSVSLSTSSLTFTSANWNVNQDIILTGVQDINVISESVTITANGTGLLAATQTITAIEDDVLAISVTGPTSVNEGSTANISVVLTNQPPFDAEVSLASNTTSSVTVPTTITFTTSNWSTPQTVTLTAIEDANETSEVVTITAASTGALTATFNINTIDNDTRVAFGSTTSVTEGGTALLAITLSGNPGTNRTVTLVSSDTTSMTISPSTLNFTTANWSTAQNVTLRGIEDLNTVGETITISATASGLVNSSKTISVVDNDAMGITLTGASSVNEGGTATISVVLTNQPSPSLTVNFVSSDTNALTLSPSSLTFTNANYTTAQTITVTGVEDANMVSENVIITATATGATTATRTVSTVENDVTIIYSGATTVNEGGTATVGVTLSGNPGISRTVSFTSGNTASMTVSSGTSSITFTTTDWNTVKNVVVSGVDDNNVFNETVLLTGTGTSIVTASTSISVVDNDTQSFTLSGTSTVTEGSSSETMGVRLAYSPGVGQALTVNISSSDTTSVTVSPSTLTFTDSNFATVQNVTLTGVEDANETSDTVTISVSANGVNTGTKVVTTIENDTRAVFSGDTTFEEVGLQGSVMVRLSGNPGISRTLTLASGNLTIMTISAGSSLSFSTTNWNTDQTVTVRGVLDANRTNETVTLTGSGSGLVTASTNLTSIDTWYNLPIKKTGITTCYSDDSVIPCGDPNSPNQDGDIQAGVTPSYTGPTQHTTYTNDYTTKDNVTGLIWKTCTEGASGATCSTGQILGWNWATAKSKCEGLNLLNGGMGYAGRQGWRLPFIKELFSLYDLRNREINVTYFPRTILYYYWSSTTYILSNDQAYSFDPSPAPRNFVQSKIQYLLYVKCVTNN